LLALSLLVLLFDKLEPFGCLCGFLKVLPLCQFLRLPLRLEFLQIVLTVIIFIDGSIELFTLRLLCHLRKLFKEIGTSIKDRRSHWDRSGRKEGSKSLRCLVCTWLSEDVDRFTKVDWRSHWSGDIAVVLRIILIGFMKTISQVSEDVLELDWLGGH
jgi:hypothetical protein